MAKQTLGQGDSNVIVRNQVIYGALPQDVIDRMGDTTLALQTTAQNVLPAINELKSDLTELSSDLTDKDLVLIASKTSISTTPSNFTYESDADDVDQYKELVMVIAWNANQVNYRISATLPTVSLLYEYPTPYFVTSMSTFNNYCKFDTKRGGTIHWSNPPSGVSASRFELYARK